MGKALLAALAGLLSIGVAGSAGAATLDFTGTLRLQVSTSPIWPVLVIPGAGSAQATDDGSLHLLSLLVPGGTFGPVTTSLPVTAIGTIYPTRFTGIQNLAGTFAGISGGPPGGGTMGLQGIVKICSVFATCDTFYIPLPLTPTPSGAGFGIGGTRTAGGLFGNVTMQHAPWTVGQPTMTIHTPSSNVTSPVFPGGFAHGPASLTSSTAQPSGELQLVAVSKVFTSLTSVFPELPVYAVLDLHFVPEPSALLMLGSGIAVLAIYGRRSRRR